MDLMTARLKLHGKHTIADIDRLQKTLLEIPGVLEASVDFQLLAGYVIYDLSQVTIEEIEETIEFLGYSAAPVWMRHGAI
jgi:copper chaperone CopZ